MESKSFRYGPDPNQYAELFLPEQRTHAGVVVIIHGGFWRAAYGADLGVPLAKDLTERGWTCWNLEYRRNGNGGGWPETFEDVAAGIDLLAEVAPEFRLGLNRVVALGHSAGGHLAAWAAGRRNLPAEAPGAHPKVHLTGAVSQSGLLNLGAAYDQWLSDGAVVEFLGGTPVEVPGRYELADPLRQAPVPVPVCAVHAVNDTTVPFSQSEEYVATAHRTGGEAELVRVPGDHMDLIDPKSEAFAECRRELERLMS
ncbi:MAG TPA: alpha/beta hydrolase [Arthrobacter sp.]|nr:alpha/beta hydrolase [Arthrobacter sp.]